MLKTIPILGFQEKSEEPSRFGNFPYGRNLYIMSHYSFGILAFILVITLTPPHHRKQKQETRYEPMQRL